MPVGNIRNRLLFIRCHSVIGNYGKARLLYTDTDSLIMLIETEDMYKDQTERPDIFDLDYSGDLFLMKDETKGEAIWQNVVLKPKMYSVLLASHDPKKKHGIQKAKGVKKCGQKGAST